MGFVSTENIAFALPSSDGSPFPFYRTACGNLESGDHLCRCSKCVEASDGMFDGAPATNVQLAIPWEFFDRVMDEQIIQNAVPEYRDRLGWRCCCNGSLLNYIRAPRERSRQRSYLPGDHITVVRELIWRMLNRLSWRHWEDSNNCNNRDCCPLQ